MSTGRHRVIAPPPQHCAQPRRRAQIGVLLVCLLALATAFYLSGQSRAVMLDSAAPPAVPTQAVVVDESAKFRNRIVDAARVYVERGTPYVDGGKNAKRGFDSSGLVWQVLKDVGRKEPYRTSVGLREWAEPIEFADLQPGDLVFYAHHVGVFVGDGQMVDASPLSDTVVEHEVWLDPYPTFGRVPD